MKRNTFSSGVGSYVHRNSSYVFSLIYINFSFATPSLSNIAPNFANIAALKKAHGVQTSHVFPSQSFTSVSCVSVYRSSWSPKKSSLVTCSPAAVTYLEEKGKSTKICIHGASPLSVEFFDCWISHSHHIRQVNISHHCYGVLGSDLFWWVTLFFHFNHFLDREWFSLYPIKWGHWLFSSTRNLSGFFGSKAINRSNVLATL